MSDRRNVTHLKAEIPFVMKTKNQNEGNLSSQEERFEPQGGAL